MKKIFYAKAVYGKNEITAATNVLKKNPLSLMDGKNVKKLEKIVARIFGKKFALMVNSGSSANLLALASLNLKKVLKLLHQHLLFQPRLHQYIN